MTELLLLENLQGEEWFKLDATREQAIEILRKKPSGNFVVRSSKSHKDHYALSYKNRDGVVTHSLIEKTAVGYKIPGGYDPRVYPTLRSLLEDCPFLNYNKPNDGKVENNLVNSIQEMFSTLPKSEVVKALELHNQNVDLAIEYLLTKSDPEPLAQSTKLEPSAPVQTVNMRPFAPVQDIKQPNVTNSDNAITKVVQLYQMISGFKANIRDIKWAWPTINPTLPMYLSQSEMNLTKILSTSTHPLGKKVQGFVGLFQQEFHGYYSASELDSKLEAAITQTNNYNYILK